MLITLLRRPDGYLVHTYVFGARDGVEHGPGDIFGFEGLEGKVRVAVIGASVGASRELGAYEPGFDARDPDALLADLHPQTLCHNRHGVLGRGVHGELRAGHPPSREAGDEGDVSRAPLEHVADGGAGGVEHAEHVGHPSRVQNAPSWSSTSCSTMVHGTCASGERCP